MWLMENVTVSHALGVYGFTKNEIAVYLACLELGTSTANSIALRASINRSTTYDILNSFIERGFASKVIKNKTSNFDVSSPKRLLAILDENRFLLNSVLPELSALQEKIIDKPVIEVFEGLEGVRTILEDILETKSSVDVYSTSKIFQIIAGYFPRYISSRSHLKLFTRVIQESCKNTEELKKKDKEENRETKALDNFNINSATFIYKNKVAKIKLVKKELVAILIKDKTIFQDEKLVFEHLWAVAF